MGPGAGRHQGRAQAAGMGGGGQGPPSCGADVDPGVPGWQVGTGSIAHSPARLLSPLLQGCATWGRSTVAHSMAQQNLGTGTQCGAPGLVRHAGRAAISWRGHGRDEVCKIQDTEGCRQHVWIPAIGTVLGCVFPALLPWAVPCLTRSRRSLSCSTFYSQSGAGQCQPSAMHWAEHSEPLHIEGFPQLAQFLLVL